MISKSDSDLQIRFCRGTSCCDIFCGMRGGKGLDFHSSHHCRERHPFPAPHCTPRIVCLSGSFVRALLFSTCIPGSQTKNKTPFSCEQLTHVSSMPTSSAYLLAHADAVLEPLPHLSHADHQQFPSHSTVPCVSSKLIGTVDERTDTNPCSRK